MNFKVWCRIKGYKLPDTDVEILRHMIACKSNEEEAYKSMRYRLEYRDKNFPLKMT